MAPAPIASADEPRPATAESAVSYTPPAAVSIFEPQPGALKSPWETAMVPVRAMQLNSMGGLMTRKLVPFGFALLSFAVSSCSSPPAADWRKPGVARNDMITALSDCRFQVGINKISPGEQNQLIVDCMQAKGFRWY